MTEQEKSLLSELQRWKKEVEHATEIYGESDWRRSRIATLDDVIELLANIEKNYTANSKIEDYIEQLEDPSHDDKMFTWRIVEELKELIRDA